MKNFWNKVKKTAGCWEWTSAKSRGYGSFTTLAHRMAWQLLRGEIPDGLHVLHSCDNPGCVNPDHLRLGTDKDNHDDCRDRGRFNVLPKAVGEKNANSKLTEWAVREIRRRTDMPTVALAKAFMVYKSTIIKVRARKAWAHVL